METAIEPGLDTDRILRELDRLWVTLGKQQPEGGVLRACAMTLIVMIEEQDDTQAAGETLARLMRDHPSRSIVVTVRPSAERALSARVLAQCWTPFGKREQICCEQIEIAASGQALSELAPALAPLIAPDLPVVLWCRSPRLFLDPGFPPVAALAGKRIVDSTAFADTAGILRLLSERPGTADLAWTRLTRWREIIAQLFENRRYRGCLGSVHSAQIVFTGARPPTHAYYLAAWLMNGLETSGCGARVALARQENAPTPAVVGIELLAGDAESQRFSVRQTEAGAAEIQVDALVNRTEFEPPSDYTLLREELSVQGPDPVFERALARALSLGGAG